MNKLRIRAIRLVPQGNQPLPAPQTEAIERALKAVWLNLGTMHLTQVIDPQGHQLRQSNETLVVFMANPAKYPFEKGQEVVAAGGFAVYAYIQCEDRKNTVVIGTPGSRYTHIERKHDKGWEPEKYKMLSGKPFPEFKTLMSYAV